MGSCACLLINENQAGISLCPAQQLALLIQNRDIYNTELHVSNGLSEEKQNNNFQFLQ